MFKKKKSIEIDKATKELVDLIDEYKEYRERDAESIKRAQLSLRLIKIGQAANKLKAIKEK